MILKNEREIKESTENGTVIKNKYDPLGFRYQKEVNGEVHKYIFDGWSIVAETNKEGELKSREVRGYSLVKKEKEETTYYYHQNEHGDIIYLSDTAGEIENSYSYDVFGNVREQQENIENIFKYAGEQLDSETQQYYLRARFYNPVIGRFTQEDMYRGDGLNLYVYVINNPLLWIDPSGYASGYYFRGDDFYDGKSNMGVKLGETVDAYGNDITINNFEDHLRHKTSEDISIYTSFSEDMQIAGKKFSKKSVYKISKADVDRLVAEGKMKVYTADDVVNYYASQGENKLAKEVKNIMKQNKEILIEGEIPKEYLKRVNQNKKGKC